MPFKVNTLDEFLALLKETTQKNNITWRIKRNGSLRGACCYNSTLDEVFGEDYSFCMCPISSLKLLASHEYCFVARAIGIRDNLVSEIIDTADFYSTCPETRQKLLEAVGLG